MKPEQTIDSSDPNRIRIYENGVLVGLKLNPPKIDPSIPPMGDYRWILIGDEWVLPEERKCEGCNRLKPLRFFQYISKVCYSCQKRTKKKNQA